MQSKIKLVNSNSTWNAKRRYKINSVVEYNGDTWQNTTGINSEPGVGSDWLKTLGDGGGGAFIPLSGTLAGMPITGDLEFGEYRNLKSYSPTSQATGSFEFDEGSARLASIDNDGEYISITAKSGGSNPVYIELQHSGILPSRGIGSSVDFSANITDLDYTQKIYVDTNFYKRKVIEDLTAYTTTAVATEQILSSVEILADFFSDGDLLGFLNTIETDSNTLPEWKLYLNTANNLSGATLIASEVLPEDGIFSIKTKGVIKGTTFFIIPEFSKNGFSASNSSFNPTNANYLILTLTQTSVDTTVQNYSILKKIN